MWKPKGEEKVTLKRTEKLGRVNLAISPCLVSPLSHCYCWTIQDERKRTDGIGTIQFACSGYRKVCDAKLSRVPKDTPLSTWIAIRNVESTVHWEGSGNGTLHFCDGPEERSEVEGKQVRRSVDAKLATGSVEKPFSAVAKLERKILEIAKTSNCLFSQQLDYLRTSKIIVCDGTFRYRPHDTAQVYRIFGFVTPSKKSLLSHCVPLVTVLMRGEDRKLYAKMWNKVCEAMEPLGTIYIKYTMCDCEKTAYKSFVDQFPKIVPKMCSFQSKQALNREVQSLGMMPTYRKEPEFAIIFRQIVALQLSPPQECTKCLELISQLIKQTNISPTQKNRLLDVLNYYK